MEQEHRTPYSKTSTKISNSKWPKLRVVFWIVVVVATIVLVLPSWTNPESTTPVGITVSVLSLFFAVYIAIWTYRAEYLKKQEVKYRTDYAKNEIYSTLRAIEDTRKHRERIRANPKALPDADFQTEVKFMSYRLERVIRSLQFVLLLNNEYLSSTFASRVNDSIKGYDFILNRLEMFPLDSDDPSKILSYNVEHFIEELATI